MQPVSAAATRRWTQKCVTAIAVVGLALSPAATASAAGDPGETEGDRSGGSPQSAMRGFLVAARAGEWAEASRFLDLRRVRPSARGTHGVELARSLKWTLDRTLWVDLESLSADPAGESDDGLPADRDRVGVIETLGQRVDVWVERAHRGTPAWRISAETVSELSRLHDELGGAWLSEHLPSSFFEARFLEVAAWQWLGLLAVSAIAIFGAWLLLHALVWGASTFGSSSLLRDDSYLRASLGPLRLLAAVGLVALAVPLLMLSVPPRAALTAILRTLTIVSFAWWIGQVVRTVGKRIEDRFRARGRLAAIALVPLGRRASLVALGAITLLAVLQNMGVNVTGILAGLGVGGLAVALAAQKTVENLFGGLTLVIDQPVRVGDFCRFGDKLGTVEEIGLRSTRVRTLDRTVVAVPNAEFASLQLETFAARDRIRFAHTIGVRYETSVAQIRQLVSAIVELLRVHPRVHPDPARVRFVGFGPYSLDLEIFAYVTTGDYDEYLEISEDLLLRIAETVLANGVEFAFPSQTVYIGTDAKVADAGTPLSA